MKPYILHILICICLLTTACNQKELENLVNNARCYHEIKATYDYRWYVLYDGGTEWEQNWDESQYFMTYNSLLPTEPTGLRVMVYSENNEYDSFNFPAHGGIFDTDLGRQTLMLFNNDTEYIIFNNIEKRADATATTRTLLRSSYIGSPYVDDDTNGNTINPPDMLYACDGGEITSIVTNKLTTIERELRPLVYKYLIRYHFDSGLHYVALARGAIAGMATSVYLSDGHTDENSATVLYDIEVGTCRQFTDEQKGEGVLYVVVCSFGAPGYPNHYISRNDKPFGLNLEVLLSNGKIMNFDFDISEQVRVQPRGGVVDVYGIEISDEDAAQGTGSFDVDVDGWGDNITVPIM